MKKIYEIKNDLFWGYYTRAIEEIAINTETPKVNLKVLGLVDEEGDYSSETEEEDVVDLPSSKDWKYDILVNENFDLIFPISYTIDNLEDDEYIANYGDYEVSKYFKTDIVNIMLDLMFEREDVILFEQLKALTK